MNAAPKSCQVLLYSWQVAVLDLELKRKVLQTSTLNIRSKSTTRHYGLRIITRILSTSSNSSSQMKTRLHAHNALSKMLESLKLVPLGSRLSTLQLPASQIRSCHSNRHTVSFRHDLFEQLPRQGWLMHDSVAKPPHRPHKQFHAE